MIRYIKRIVPAKLKRNIKENLGVPSLHWALMNLKKNGFQPDTVYDIGAFVGNWTKDFLEVFPQSNIFMFEAQHSKEHSLKELKKVNKRVEYHIALLSDEDNKEVMFEENETASYIVNNGSKINATKRQTVKLDSLIKDNQLPFPDFLKLDVQGHEKAVLQGGRLALDHAEVCLLEISILDLGDNFPLIQEMLNFMSECGYQAYDILHFIRRPYDKALFQIDMLFVKKNSYLISSKRWA